MDAVGALRVEAYQADNFLAGAPSYTAELRNLGTGGHGTVLVAVTGTELLGTVTLETWHSGSEIARDAGEEVLSLVRLDAQRADRVHLPGENLSDDHRCG